MSGTLYIVATPIGNLKDITIRAIKILSQVDIILAEDTRITSKLISSLAANYNLKPVKTISYHQHSGLNKISQIAKSIIAGKNIALVTDAGTPGISDPGNDLISYLTQVVPDIKIVPIPGPSAITASLSVSGLNVSKFVFLGFLPKKKRTKLFNWLKKGKISFAFYESPKRILKTLEILEQEFGSSKKVFIAQEMTKYHEKLYRGNIKEVKESLNNNSLKGEMVVVVE